MTKLCEKSYQTKVTTEQDIEEIRKSYNQYGTNYFIDYFAHNMKLIANKFQKQISQAKKDINDQKFRKELLKEGYEVEVESQKEIAVK